MWIKPPQLDGKGYLSIHAGKVYGIPYLNLENPQHDSSISVGEEDYLMTLMASKR
jgi:hypothetical protein